MQPYLFQLNKEGTTKPWEVFSEILAAQAYRVLTIVDPCPPASILDTLGKSSANLKKRLITQLSSKIKQEQLVEQIMQVRTWESLENKGVLIRTLDPLSSRLYAADDKVLVISGNWESKQSYGVLIQPPDSAPVLELIENLWRSADKVELPGNDLLQDRMLRLLNRSSNAKGFLIGHINRHGAILSIHVHFFKGWNKQTLLLPIDSKKSENIAVQWTMISSDHFRRLSQFASRVYALKSRRFLVDTPAGPFLLNSDRERWESEFADRSTELQKSIDQYLEQNFDVIKNEALSSLRVLIQDTVSTMAKTGLLPFTSEKEFVEEFYSGFSTQFPSRKQLHQSCSAFFLRLALHPDSIENQTVMDMIVRISEQIRLI